MRIGSLFSGVGGLDLGLEWAGVGETVFQVEKDEYARSVLARHWPNAQRFDDIRTVGERNLPRVDVLCGGFPCQDISFAGKGAGLAGARSGLWFEYARIIRELQPSYIVVENVAALRTRGLDVVTSEISALGYDMWWDCIPASAIGAPQQRDRLFIIAWKTVADTVFVDSERIDSRDNSACQPLSASVGVKGPTETGDGRQTMGGERRRTEPRLGRNTHGLSDWLDQGWPSRPQTEQKSWEPPRVEALVGPSKKREDRLRCIGNAVAPPVGYFIGCMLMWIHGQRNRQRP
jgi:DNA (cytosine-5)-methyltransferase 1